MKLKARNKNKSLPNIQTRLFTGLALLLALLMIVSVFYIKDIEKLNSTTEDLFEHPYTVSNAVRDINININAIQRLMKDVVLAKNEEQLKEAVDKINEYEKKVFERFNLIFERFLGQPETVEDAYMYFKNWKAIRDRAISLTLNQKIDEAADITKGEGDDYVELLLNKTENMIAFSDTKANSYITDSLNILKAVKRKAFIFILLVFVFGLILFTWILNSINRPLSKIISKIRNIPQEKLINTFPKNEKNKLVLLDFIINELVSHREILEQKVTERTRELTESQEIINHAINNAPIGIVQIGLDGKFIKANQEFCNLLGYSLKELLKLTFNDITSEEDKSIGDEIIKNILEGKTSFGKFQKRYIHKSGTVIYCSLTTAIVKDLNKAPLYFFTQIVDISKQKSYELELTERKKELEYIVKTRDEELDYKTGKLIKSQKALTYLIEDVNESQEKMKVLNQQIVATNRELETFSYSVSHDLKAPLRAVIGFSEILEEEYSANLANEAKRYIGQIKENAQNMGQLITDLLNFSRLGRKSLRSTQIDLMAIAKRVWNEIEPGISEPKPNVIINTMPIVNADESLIYHVMQNLISNAVKFTRSKANALIEIGCSSQENKDIYYVKDNGIGFDMKYAEKIFDVFERLHGLEEYEGTGIGLAIVRRILHKHDGKIWAQSEKNKGTTFFFVLQKYI